MPDSGDRSFAREDLGVAAEEEKSKEALANVLRCLRHVYAFYKVSIGVQGFHKGLGFGSVSGFLLITCLTTVSIEAGLSLHI